MTSALYTRSLQSVCPHISLVMASWTTRRIFIMSNILLLPKLQYLIFGISIMIYLSDPAYEFALINDARCGLCGGQKGKRDAQGEGRQGLDEAGTRGLSTAAEGLSHHRGY